MLSLAGAMGNALDTIYGRAIIIDVLSTVTRATDRIEIVIPNSQFISQQIVNYSLSHSYIYKGSNSLWGIL